MKLTRNLFVTLTMSSLFSLIALPNLVQAQGSWSTAKVVPDYFGYGEKYFKVTADGSKLVLVKPDSSGRLLVRNLLTQQESLIPAVKDTKGNTVFPGNFVISDDGTKLATQGASRFIDLRSLRDTERWEAPYTGRGYCQETMFTPDRFELVVLNNDSCDANGTLDVRIKNFRTGRMRYNEISLTPYFRGVNGEAALSRDASMLVVESSTSEDLTFVDLKAKKIIPSHYAKGYGRIESLTFSAKGFALVIRYYRKVLIWDVRTMQPIKFFEDATAVISQDGTKAVVRDSQNGLQIVDLDSGTIQQLPAGNLLTSYKHFLLTPDASKLVVADWDGLTQIIDLTTAKILFSIEMKIKDSTMFITPDGAKVAALGEGNKAAMLDLTTFRQETVPFSYGNKVARVEFAKDGSTVVISDRIGNMAIWYRDAQAAEAK